MSNSTRSVRPPHPDDLRRLVDGLDADRREAFEERAAVMEFDGGLTRAEAEWRAYLEVTGGRKRHPR